MILDSDKGIITVTLNRYITLVKTDLGWGIGGGRGQRQKPPQLKFQTLKGGASRVPRSAPDLLFVLLRFKVKEFTFASIDLSVCSADIDQSVISVPIGQSVCAAHIDQSLLSARIDQNVCSAHSDQVYVPFPHPKMK